MSEKDADALGGIADAICDGTSVDWEFELHAHRELAKRIEQLRDLQSIADAHRMSNAKRWAAPEATEAGQLEEGAATAASSDSWQSEVGLETPDSKATTIPLETSPPAAAGPDSVRPGPPVPLTWGPLRILEQIGQGGFGEVYRAYDPSLQREVALKLLRPHRAEAQEAMVRLLEEARRLARIRHPNVVVVHGVGEHDGRAGIWTDLVRGQTLQDLAVLQGPMGAHEATGIGIELCRALAALHGAGLVHRDVKPANVMREQGGRIVLMDFGSTAERIEDPGTSRELEGTPILMAPELLLRGERPSPATDLYSLGVLLYWLASGRFPIEGRQIAEIIAKHRISASVPLRDVRPDLPTAFVQIVERAMDPDLGRRYASAGKMERDMSRSLGTFAPSEPSAGAESIPYSRALEEVERSLQLRAPQSTGEAATVTANAAVTAVDLPTSGAAAHPTPSQTVAAPKSWWRRHRRGLARGGVATALAVAVVAAVFLKSMFQPLHIDAALYRQSQGAEEQLDPGAVIHPGEHLFLEIEGSRSMYVYVINEDEKGRVFALFPMASGTGNPLPPHVRHRLPSSPQGDPSSWEVTDAGGTETILVLAATEPREDIEQELERYPRPGHKSRSLGSVVPEEAGAVTHRLESIVDRSTERRLRMWQIQVQNQGE